MVTALYPSRDEIITITKDAPYNETVNPIVAYNLMSKKEAESRFKTQGELLYARFGNSVSHHVENITSDIDGAHKSLSTTSGTSANFLIMLALSGYSQHLASSSHIFGGTYGGQQGILANVHMKTHYFDPRNPASLEKILKAKKKIGAVFLETISNADNVVPDIEGIVDVAHAYKKPVVFDNTYAFGQFQPLKWGADFSTVSLTKGGGGGKNDVVGGLIQSRGESTQDLILDPKLYPFIANYHKKVPTDPDPTMGVLYNYCGSGLGAPLQIPSALIISNGLESLIQRTDLYNSNASLVASHLDDDKYKRCGLIKNVNHLSLEHHPDHERIKNYTPGYFGSVMLVDFGSEEKAEAFIDNSGYVGVHIMQNALMVTHPATTTHRQYTQEMQTMLGVNPGVVRITVGNQNRDEVMEQVNRGLYYAAQVV
jgi:O-acetylhomoserine (thiol)-lyase